MAESDFDAANALTIRGRAVRFDANGLACLDDIWKAAGFSKNQPPSQWARLPSTIRKMERVSNIIGKSQKVTKETMHLVYRTKRGEGAGTYADVRLALDYAEYLNPALAIEVKEVYLRFKGSDPTLADDLMQGADAESNEWLAKRSISRATRLTYTNTLKAHGVVERVHFALCTNAIYEGLFGKTAKQLKAERCVKKGLRDAMSLKEIATVSFSEVLSVDRIEDEKREGFVECKDATFSVAKAVRGLLESEKQARQPRLF
jgi:KilA-N domain